MLEANGGKRVVTAYCQTTDAGSDQMSDSRTIAEEVIFCLPVMHLHGSCVRRKNHLAFKLNLRMSEFVLRHLFCVDLFYFGNLCKLCNTWRECGKEVYFACAKDHGPLEALLSERCPRPCLVGRWGAAYESEKPFLPPDRAHLTAVLGAVLSANQRKAKKPTDELQAEGQD